MQPGAEYILILNDRELREVHLQRSQKEGRSIQQRQTGRSQGATRPIAHVVMAIRASLTRFRRLSPSTPV
jgi:hypothetical protein